MAKRYTAGGKPPILPPPLLYVRLYFIPYEPVGRDTGREMTSCWYVTGVSRLL